MLSDLVRQFDAGEDDAGIHERLKAEHAGTSSLNRAMILLDYVVETLAGANLDLLTGAED